MEEVVLNQNRKIDNEKEQRVILWAINTYREVRRSGSELHNFV